MRKFISPLESIIRHTTELCREIKTAFRVNGQTYTQPYEALLGVVEGYQQRYQHLLDRVKETSSTLSQELNYVRPLSQLEYNYHRAHRSMNYL